MLVDPHQTTQETKQEVAFIIAHELAHQWFGNLVVRISSFDLFLIDNLFDSFCRQWNGGMICG